jgi:hypothetical protein
MLIDRIPGERTTAAAVRDAVNVVILVDCDQRHEPLARIRQRDRDRPGIEIEHCRQVERVAIRAHLGGPKRQVTKVHEPAHRSRSEADRYCIWDACGRAAAKVVAAQSVSAAVIIEPAMTCSDRSWLQSSLAGRRSAAIIHRCRPFGARTLPNHSRRSRTHQSSVPAADHVATCTSTGGSTARRSASP